MKENHTLKPFRKRHWAPALLLTTAMLFMPVQPSLAKDVPIVDGKLWLASSYDDKLSYLVGIANLMDVEYAYQQRSPQPPSDRQTLIRKLYEEIDELTLNQLIERIDQWYREHPEQQGKAVLGVIWREFVESN